jgi:rubrerythrin
MANAKPTLMSKRQRPNPNAQPTMITRIRCQKCNTKWIMEERGKECPNGCDKKKKKKAD